MHSNRNVTQRTTSRQTLPARYLGAYFLYLTCSHSDGAPSFFRATQISPGFSSPVEMDYFFSLYRLARGFKWRARSLELGTACRNATGGLSVR